MAKKKADSEAAAPADIEAPYLELRLENGEVYYAMAYIEAPGFRFPVREIAEAKIVSA